MKLLSEDEQVHIRKAIEAAERFTSGEIRVCMDKSCKEPVLDRAAHYFFKLGMDSTRLRNGVLIYLAVKDRQFAVIGDAGINKVVPDNFWDSTKDAMLVHFKNGRLAEGIITGITLAGKQLQAFFPYNRGDNNELPNDVALMDGE